MNSLPSSSSSTLKFNDRGQPLSGTSYAQQIYTKLQGVEIRTLLLSPSSVSQTTVIAHNKNKSSSSIRPPVEKDLMICELEVIPNTQSHQYEALSYVWGGHHTINTSGNNKITPRRKKETIECNGIAVPITKSLYDALRSLRYPQSWRRLWVDQLCINQPNPEELRAQVGQMGSIYRDACRVVVWLGIGAESRTRRPDDLDDGDGDGDERERRKLAGAWRLIRETSLGGSLVRSDFLGLGGGREQEEMMTPSRTGKSRIRRKDKSGNRSGSGIFSFSSASSSSRRSLRSGSRSASSTSLSSSLSSFKSTSSSMSLSRSSLNSSTDSIALSSSSRTPISRRSKSYSTEVSPNLKKALSIFQHEWFTRKWTFQEIVMSKAAIVCCGDIEMAWSDLASWYFHYAAKRRSSTLLYDSLGSFENVMNVRSQLEREDDGERPNLKLSELLMVTRQRNSLKAEDTIYALLGLHAGFSKHLSAIDEEDGWLPVFELFLTAFKYCLQVEKDLSVLSAAGLYTGNKMYPFWPTWLPDWREHLPIRPLILHATEIYGYDYCAAGTTNPEANIVEHEYGRFTLLTKGFRIGVAVTRAGSWPNCYFVADESAQNILDERIPSTHAKPISIFSSLDEASIVTSSDYARKVVSSAIQRQEVCELVSTFAAACTGDWICTLLGGTVLYILRPMIDDGDALVTEGDVIGTRSSSVLRCKFVGECAITGLMDGSLMTIYDQSAVTDEFELV